MPESITLYRVDGSCSMASNALLKHLKIPFESIRMKSATDGFTSGYEAADGSFSNEEYKAKINPSGYVPALVIDGKTITENPVILTFIPTLKPESDLLGEDVFETAKVLEWLVWLSGSLHASGYGAYLRPYRYADDGSAHDSIKAKGLKTILGCYERIEARIDGLHAVGIDMTVVDIFLHVFYRWGVTLLGPAGVNMGQQYPRYTALAKEMEQSCAGLREAMAEEGQKLLFPNDSAAL